MGGADTRIGLAYAAACKGRLDEVEKHLDELRRASGEPLRDLTDELYRLVECVRAHPSFDAASSDAREAC